MHSTWVTLMSKRRLKAMSLKTKLRVASSPLLAPMSTYTFKEFGELLIVIGGRNAAERTFSHSRFKFLVTNIPDGTVGYFPDTKKVTMMCGSLMTCFVACFQSEFVVVITYKGLIIFWQQIS